MKILKFEDRSEQVRMERETEETKPLLDWVHIDYISQVEEHLEEGNNKYPHGMTYDEAAAFMESK